jgi:predicted nucleic-acid-binding protein
VVIVETAWVLERSYGLPDVEVATAIESMLQTDVLVLEREQDVFALEREQDVFALEREQDVFALEREQDVFATMMALEGGLGSFADVLVGSLGSSAGCSVTLTFDRRAAAQL